MERALGISKDCFVVRGYLRSAIYDTRRQAYSLIGHQHAEEMQSFVGVSEAQVREQMDPVLLQFLLEQEFVYFWPVGVLHQFTDISLTGLHPYLLDHAIVEGRDFQVLDALGPLLDCGCKHFLVILHDAVTLESLDNYLENAGFDSIPTIDFYLANLTGANPHKIKAFVRKFAFVASICVQNAKRDLFFIEKQVPIAISKMPMSPLAPVKSPDTFFTNLPLFIESRQHNPYFHRKIYVGCEGEIRNAPECRQVFGNIRDITGEEILQIAGSAEFQRYWHIPKDNIEVCRDCEFRYMCVDARLPIQRSDGSWYFATECEYNPYICKWNDEEAYRNLESCGIQCDETGFVMDAIRLRAVQQEIWDQVFQD